MSSPPSSWSATRLRWMQPPWGRWKPHFTWFVLSAPKNTQRKSWAAWHKSRRRCWRPEPTLTCRTARAGRSRGFWFLNLTGMQRCSPTVACFVELRCMKLWRRGMSRCSTSCCSANSKFMLVFINVLNHPTLRQDWSVWPNEQAERCLLRWPMKKHLAN